MTLSRLAWTTAVRSVCSGRSLLHPYPSSSSLEENVGSRLGLLAAAGSVALCYNHWQQRHVLVTKMEEPYDIQPPKRIPKQQAEGLLRRKMTSIGHFSLISETLHNPSIVTFVMTLKTRKDNPWTADRFCKLWEKTQMPQRHERFHYGGVEREGYFVQKTSEGGIQFHVSESLPPVLSKWDVLERIRNLQTQRWDLTEKLWHVYIVPWTKTGMAGTSPHHQQQLLDRPKISYSPALERANEEGESLIFFQGHHALADGVSIGAALLDLMDEANEIRAAVQQEIERRMKAMAKKSWWLRWFQRLQFFLWLLLGSCLSAWYQLQLYLYQTFWDPPDPWSILEQVYFNNDTGSPEQQATRKLKADRSISFTTVGSVDQAKWTAHTLAGKHATVNDLFCAAVSRALARQLEWHRQRLPAIQTKNTKSQLALPRMPHLHVAVPVHLKGGIIAPGESVSNSIGAFCVRLPGEQKLSGEKRLKLVHQELSRVKKLPTAFVSYYIAKMSTQLLPPSWVSFLFSKASAGASCVVTNVRGPDIPSLHLNGSKVESIYGFVPLPPGIPIGVVVGSRSGQVHLTLTAQPWAVPDADQFLSWILEEYLNMVHEAKTKAAKHLKN